MDRPGNQSLQDSRGDPVRLENGLQHQLQGRLDHPVGDGGMPSFLSFLDPRGFGILRSRTGSGRNVPALSWACRSSRNSWAPVPSGRRSGWSRRPAHSWPITGTPGRADWCRVPGLRAGGAGPRPPERGFPGCAVAARRGGPGPDAATAAAGPAQARAVILSHAGWPGWAGRASEWSPHASFRWPRHRAGWAASISEVRHGPRPRIPPRWRWVYRSITSPTVRSGSHSMLLPRASGV
jgi:hypothetical protein